MTAFSKGHKKNFYCKGSSVLQKVNEPGNKHCCPLHIFLKLGISETKFHTEQRPVTSTLLTFYRETTKAISYYCNSTMLLKFNPWLLPTCLHVSEVSLALNLTNQLNSTGPTKTQRQSKQRIFSIFYHYFSTYVPDKRKRTM